MPRIKSVGNVLFVCRANVGRSQMAEAIFRALAGDEHTVKSAGIDALGSDGTDLNGMLLKDRPSSKHVIECLREIGIDTSSHVIERLTPEMVENADKIFIMAKSETVPEFLKSSGKAVYWDIEDPDKQNLEMHKETRDKIKELIEEENIINNS